MRRRELSPALVELGIHDVEDLERLNAIGAQRPRDREVRDGIETLKAELPAPAPRPLRVELSIRQAAEHGYFYCEECSLAADFLPAGKHCARCNSARVIFEPPIF